MNGISLPEKTKNHKVLNTEDFCVKIWDNLIKEFD